MKKTSSKITRANITTPTAPMTRGSRAERADGAIVLSCAGRPGAGWIGEW
jgi:hypothetical protein